jgi:LysM repeat protein
MTTIAASAALTAGIAFAVPAVNIPVQAASVSSTQSQVMQYNQADFYNYMAYNALLLKRVEDAANKMASAAENPSKAKGYLAEMKATQQKIKSYSVKNKEILPLKNEEVSLVNTVIDLENLELQMFSVKNPSESQMKKFDDQMSSLVTKGDKQSQQLANSTTAFMKKYKVKKNASINYVAYDGDSSLISTKTFSYIVKKGDDLNHIAQTYGVKAADIKALNKLKSNQLKTGQTLKIAVK